MVNEQQGRSLLGRLHPLSGGLHAFFKRHRIASMIVGQVVVLAVVGMFVLNGFLGINIFSAFAEISCPAGNTAYTVQPGDTLGRIAAAHGTSWQTLAQQNQISNPNLIYANHQICIPGNGSTAPAPEPQSTNTVPLHNTANAFPFASCTWWANQRYHDLHGYYVPWTTNSNANQWTARALDFHWRVSTEPSVGAIIDLQGGVQLSSSLGHVAVVEQILGNGEVLASNMNIWGHPPAEVVYLRFHTGPGVTFITA
jgi:surface antigen